VPLKPEQLKRAAEQFILKAQAASAGQVAVIWQRDGEESDTFAGRAVAARAKLHHQALLVAVCGFDVMQKTRGVCVVEMPPVMLTLFDGPARYRVCYGGRGAGRSWSFSRALIVRALQSRVRILCCREFQNSISDSVLTLLSDQIELLGLSNYFEVQATAIYARNGSEFIFSGIRSNPTRIKSLEGAAIAYVEEAESITNTSWEILIPTIRAAGSEIWGAFNPDLEDAPTHQRFVAHPPDNAIVIKTTFADNQRFPEPLRQEAEYLARVDDDAFRHVWLGECRQHSEAQIFRGKYVIESFKPDPTMWNGPYAGADWGFSRDPSVLVRLWVHEATLFIEYEAYGIGVDIDKLPALFDQVPDARKAVIRADSARPETISYMTTHGYPNMQSVTKWSGSVEDGVAHMRSYEKIVIHPRCVHAAQEFRLYSYKVDKLSGDVLVDIVDRDNHIIDACRYGLQPLIKTGGAGAFLSYLAGQVAKDKATAPVAAKARGGIITPFGGGP
jgi:phage terminase large subunit